MSTAVDTHAATSFLPRLFTGSQSLSSRGLLAKVAKLEPEMRILTDEQLRKRSLSLRYRAKSGDPREQLMPEGFALVREAGRRTLDMRHYDVQILGGAAIFDGAIAEMQTGEGKTLTATLPTYLAALAGRGAHVATVNDYLARRDAELMRSVYEALGLTVGVVETDMPAPQRQLAYACDVTYGTAKEFGFDFLKDRLLLRQQQVGGSDLLGRMLGYTTATAQDKPLQREPYYILVDEADSVLIDEARTPLVISSLPTDTERAAVEAFRWVAEVAKQFTAGTHFDDEEQGTPVELNVDGRRLTRELQKPTALDLLGMIDIYEYIERAIHVERNLQRDREYVVAKGEVVIVDEFTGRAAEGRRWRDGVHQAIEAREGLKVGVDTGQAARITVQDFFLRYRQLCGMTGTAASSARELRKIYKLSVATIATNRPPVREKLSARVFATADEKWSAMVEEIAELNRQGRPVLVGTRSIDKSEHLGRLLAAAGISHQVLNAKNIEQEAEIIADAGHRGRVTVATNMAGRGTDIKLGPGVEALGGLHVICSEMHDSARIDRQLIGRCGRQGDPGSWRQYLAADDDLLREGLGDAKAEKLARQAARNRENLDRMETCFLKAQKSLEQRYYQQRKLMMHLEHQSQEVHRRLGQDPFLDRPSS